MQKFTDIRICVNSWLNQSINWLHNTSLFRTRTETYMHAYDMKTHTRCSSVCFLCFLNKTFHCFCFFFISFFVCCRCWCCYCMLPLVLWVHTHPFDSDSNNREHLEHKQFCVERLNKKKIVSQILRNDCEHSRTKNMKFHMQICMTKLFTISFDLN